jgi:flagellar FliL protein
MAASKKNTPDGSGAARTRAVAVAIVLFLAAVALSGGWYYYHRTASGSGVISSESPLPETETEISMGPMVDIREFIVNIISDDNSHYLRLSMTIELSSQAAHDELVTRMPQVRDAILMLASNKTFEELYDLHGKKQLKAELLIELNEMLTRGEAVAVYFTDFVVQ